MKKHKYKTLGFQTQRNHAKLIFQWIRKGDVEVTLVIIKGDYKYMSGYFAIADTKSAAVQLLQSICYKNRPPHNQEVMRVIPWNNVIAKLSKSD
jgi:hypothetical protein